MKTISASLAIALFILLSLSGCEQTATSEQATSAEAVEPVPVKAVEEAKIEWFEGSVDEAFALAKAENKPVFLYWGAVWCPPCIEIKQTVFKSQQFIAQTKLFVPVYLDGDTERAQIYGEKFVTKVYPTMIVFNPAGEEITRLHAGIDISAYNTVLQLSLDSMRPTSDLVETALEDPSSLTESDLQRLAYYSWYDNEIALPEDTSPELFNTLSQVAAEHSPTLSARFYLQYLVMLSGEESTKADPAQLRAILESPELMFACWDYLTSYPQPIMAALDGSEAELESLQNDWATVVKESRHDERLSTAKQMNGWSPYLVFHSQGDEVQPLPEDVIAAVREDGKAADEKTSGTHSRQSVINTVSGIYMKAGLTEDARALLLAEIEKSNTPYYFMSVLAYLEEEQGDIALALEWRKKAYEASEGAATRIRWWARYVQSVVRMAPENSEFVQQAAMAIFDGSQSLDDAFIGFNFRNIEKTAMALEKWDEENQPEEPVLNGFKEGIAGLCDKQSADSPEWANCQSLLVADE